MATDPTKNVDMYQLVRDILVQEQAAGTSLHALIKKINDELNMLDDDYAQRMKKAVEATYVQPEHMTAKARKNHVPYYLDYAGTPRVTRTFPPIPSTFIWL